MVFSAFADASILLIACSVSISIQRLYLNSVAILSVPMRHLFYLFCDYISNIQYRWQGGTVALA